MPFRSLALAVSALCGILCLTLIFLPQLVYWMFQLEGNALGDFLAKRAGILFLGLSVLCFCSRNTTSVEVQRLLSLTIGVTMGAMALLGVIEFFRGAVGIGIFLAIAIEVLFAVLSFAHLNRKSERA